MPSFVFTAASFSVCNVERNQIVLKFTQVVICGLGLVLVDGLVHVLTRNNFCVLCHGHLCLYEFPCWLCYSQVIVSNCCDLCAVAGDASASVCSWGQRQRRCLKTIGFHRRGYAFIFTQGGLLTPIGFFNKNTSEHIHDVVYSNTTPSRPIGLITPLHCALLSNRMKNRANGCILY